MWRSESGFGAWGLGFGIWDLLRAISPRDLDVTFVPIGRDAQLPWVAADLAILDEGTSDLRLQVNLHFLAAVRTRDVKLRVHDAAILPACVPGITVTGELR